jgi:hypothetical protein
MLHLTHRGRCVPLAIHHLPEEDFLVYTSPFTSPAAYSAGRDLVAGPLPFLGLFFCPTASPGDAKLLNRLCDTDDLLQVEAHLRRLRRELVARRDTFQAKQSNRTIVNEQDLAYEAALAEQQRREDEQRAAEERKKTEEAERQERLSAAAARHDALRPVPRDANPADVTTVKFILPDREPKIRDFLKSDAVQSLFDFIDIDVAPLLPVLVFGFPPTRINRSKQWAGKTLTELKFTKKEVMRVVTDDDGEEDS